MAKLQHTFIQGKMNKDLDERLVPNGQYRDAQNIQVSTSEGSDVGAVENILGNTKKNLRSTGPDVFWQSSFGLQNPVCIGVIKDSQNEKIYWFLNSADSSTDAIVEYDQTTGIVAPILVDVNGVLNFNKLNLITGVNILEGLLFFTDDISEPKVINISAFKAGSTDFVTQTNIYGAPFVLENVTVIVKSPNIQATVLAEPSLVGGNATGITPVETTQLNFNTGTPTFKPVAPGTVYTNVAFSAAVLFNPFKREVSLTAQDINESNIIENYEVICSLSNIAANGLSGDLTVISASSNVPDKFIPWSMLLIESDPIFRNDFPRFSYRWRYSNGEYSTYAPFTKAAFVPNKFQYLSSNGFNEGMDNVTRKITLSNFQSPGSGVENIEILYKSAVSNNIYVLQTIDLSAGALSTFVITDELLGNVVESSQLLRPWDNVPKKAKSQEVIGNRIVYGNYLQNYNVNAAVDITAAQVDSVHTNPGYGLQSIKTDRTYQIGITFIDEFNRESPVFTNKDASQVVEIKNSEKSNTFTAQLNSTPPSWATAFKYYIKEPTAEYYNLALDRFYDSEDGNVWLSFPSSEVNKIREGEYMLLKKQHDASLPVKSQNRYKILDVRSEAPEYISNQNAIVAQITAETSAGGFTVGDKEISFVAPSNRDAEDFYNLFNNLSSLQFTNGVYRSAIYSVESGGPGLLDTTTVTQVFEATLEKAILSQDAWLANLSASAGANLTVILYNKSNQFLPEFQGRFFAKINRNQTFIDNVEVTFTNNSSNIIVDQSADVETASTITTGTLASSGAAWTDPLKTSGPTFSAPTAGSPDWTFTAANIPASDALTVLVRSLQPGIDVRFYDTNNNFSRVYTIFSSSVPATGNLGNATYARSNLFGGYFNEITMTSAYDDTIVPNGIQIVSERVSPDTDVLSSTNPAVFETEPNDIADADIYYEVGKALPIADAGNVNTLDWFNCYSFGNGVESDRIRDDFNAPQMGNGVRVSSTLDEPYEEERRASSLIFSGIFNSISGVNNTNQFLAAENITKDLNPTYGSIQKLHARDTDLIALCEDKCFKILANKDALFNADGNTNVTSNANVLGQTIPFVGEYGISKNPESFASFGFRAYFTDKARGAVMRLSRDGLTDISDKGMSYFFQDGLKTNVNPNIIGAYDSDAGSYNVVVGGEGVSFKEKSDGWNTRLSYDPEAGISLNNEYYTFKSGELYEHSNATRSNFYGVQENTTVTPLFNDAPTSVKNFKTLSYEGDEGWIASIATNEQSGEVNTWKKREGIYFNYITGDGTFFLANLDGDVTNSNTIVIAAPNTNISTGDTITGVGISGIVTVTGIAADKITITMSSAQTLADGVELTFTKVADIDTSEFSVMGIGNVLRHEPPYNTIMVNGEINVSLQPGDIILTNDSSNVLRVVGTVLSINRTASTITLTASSAVVLPTVPPAFILFAKNSEANTSGLLGYYGEAVFSTSSSDKKELFAVNSEIFISSE